MQQETRPTPTRGQWLAPVPTALLIVYSAWYLRPFLADGLPAVWDAPSHLTRAWFASSAFAKGRYPTWTLYWYGGFAPLRLYGPAFYLIAGGLDQLVHDIVRSTKLVVWAGQIASIVTMCWFLRRLTASSLAAGIGALLFLTSPARLHLLAVVGTYPVVIIHMLFPALLLMVAGYAERRVSTMAFICSQALLMAGLYLANLANAIYVLPSLLAFTLVAVWGGATSVRGRVGVLLLPVALAAVLAWWEIVPSLLALPASGLSLDLYSAAGNRVEPLELLILAGFRPFSLQHVWLQSHGPLWCVLALAMCPLALRQSDARYRGLVAGFLTCLASAVVFNERASIALPFFLYPLAVGAVCSAAGVIAQRSGEIARSLALLLVLIVVLATRNVSWQGRGYSASGTLTTYAALPASPTQSRTFDVTSSALPFDGFYGVSMFSPAVSGRGIPFGGYPQGASLYSSVQVTLFGNLLDDLRNHGVPQLSREALDVLYLSHVQYLIDRSPTPVFASLPTDPAIGTVFPGGVLRLAAASPAVFAPQVARLPPQDVQLADDHGQQSLLLRVLERLWVQDPVRLQPYPSLDVMFRTAVRSDWQAFAPVVQAMEIDRLTGTARTFFGETALPPESQPADGVVFTVIRHREEADSATVVAESTQAGFVRLSYTYDAALRVDVDGVTAAVTPDVFGAILLRFPRGRHTIELRHGPSRLAGVLAIGSLLCVAVLVTVKFRDRRGFAPQFQHGRR